MKKESKYKHVVVSEDTKEWMDNEKGEMSYNSFIRKELMDLEIGKKLDLILQKILNMKEVVR